MNADELRAHADLIGPPAYRLALVRIARDEGYREDWYVEDVDEVQAGLREAADALEWNRRAIAARALDDAADAWIPDEQDGLARWFDFVPDRLRARAARVRSGELKA